jgi:hypothetical protein
VLSATPRDLSEKARQLLDEKETAVTMLGSPSAFDKAQQDGLDMRREKLL